MTITETIEQAFPHDLIGALNRAVARQKAAIAPVVAAMERHRSLDAAVGDRAEGLPFAVLGGEREITTRQALDHLGKVVRNAQHLSDLECVMLVAELGNLVQFIAAEYDRRYPGAVKPAKPRGNA
jgi:hypothetical protein